MSTTRVSTTRVGLSRRILGTGLLAAETSHDGDRALGQRAKLGGTRSQAPAWSASSSS
ncbi:MAG TPA: hypothetical protein VFQ74_06320 [Pseudolysinimonas sp.]|nr:hypothetical protein [Pseudolysinimonas sp.]